MEQKLEGLSDEKRREKRRLLSKPIVDAYYAWLDTIFKLAGKLKKAIPNASEPVDVVVSGVKILNGRDMEAGEFTFTLTQIDRNGNPMAGVAPLTATNIAGNSGEAKEFSFAPLTYDLNDYNSAVYFDSDHKALFYYLVEEKIPDGAVDSIVNGISYSTAKFLVVVRLSYSNRHLEAEQAYYVYNGSIPDNLLPTETLTQV